MQTIIPQDSSYNGLNKYLLGLYINKVFLVCGRSIEYMPIYSYIKELEEEHGISIVRFSGFQPNPLYSSVKEGVRLFRDNSCDAILAVGGGSAIDVAKCVKLFSQMDSDKDYLEQNIIPSNIPFIAVPTTAGTGSESTRFAVIYNNGQKLSISHDSGIPTAVLFDVNSLKTLPEYHKKASMLDALCHGVESFWSVNSTEESRRYSAESIKLIMDNKESYLSNKEEGLKNMLRAANAAGKAINISQTTAGHAMCYKLTGMYGIAHGHAAALCNNKLIPFMLENMDRCIDKRGKEHLKKVFDDIAISMKCKSAEYIPERFSSILREMDIKALEGCNREDTDILTDSVNEQRLKNHPVLLTKDDIRELYRKIIGVKQ